VPVAQQKPVGNTFAIGVVAHDIPRRANAISVGALWPTCRARIIEGRVAAVARQKPVPATYAIGVGAHDIPRRANAISAGTLIMERIFPSHMGLTESAVAAPVHQKPVGDTMAVGVVAHDIPLRVDATSASVPKRVRIVEVRVVTLVQQEPVDNTLCY